jgi:D-alanyl-D-alanine carboxypeptidase
MSGARLAVGGAMRACAVVLSLCWAGCAAEPAWVDGELGVWREGLTVGAAGGCSTAIVAGLSQQLIDEQNCIRPNALASFAGLANVSLSANVNAFLEPPAVNGLQAAVAANGATLDVTSAFRTLAQQYLLYKWQGSCGIQIAAVPGNSNHETGIAIDVSNHDAYRVALENHGWRWYGSGDVVHFDWVGGGTVDLRADSVLAFQKLWNANHPADAIGEDGVWGPMTQSRLEQTDVNGFAAGTTCAAPPPVAEWAAKFHAEGGARALVPRQSAEVWVEFENVGTRTWRPGETNLGTAGPHDRASALASPGWLGPNRPATVEKQTAPGEVGRFTFVVTAPDAPAALSESFALVEESVTWFGAGGDWTLALDVEPFVDRAAPLAAADAQKAAGALAADAAAGCVVGASRRADAGAVAPFAFVLLAGLWIWRRRRRRR